MLKLNYTNIEHNLISIKYLDLKFDIKKLTSSKFLSFQEVNSGDIFYFSDRDKFIEFFKSDDTKIYCHCIIDDIYDENSLDLTCVNFIDCNLLFSAEKISIF